MIQQKVPVGDFYINPHAGIFVFIISWLIVMVFSVLVITVVLKLTKFAGRLAALYIIVSSVFWSLIFATLFYLSSHQMYIITWNVDTNAATVFLFFLSVIVLAIIQYIVFTILNSKNRLKFVLIPVFLFLVYFSWPKIVTTYQKNNGPDAVSISCLCFGAVRNEERPACLGIKYFCITSLPSYSCSPELVGSIEVTFRTSEEFFTVAQATKLINQLPIKSKIIKNMSNESKNFMFAPNDQIFSQKIQGNESIQQFVRFDDDKGRETYESTKELEKFSSFPLVQKVTFYGTGENLEGIIAFNSTVYPSKALEIIRSVFPNATFVWTNAGQNWIKLWLNVYDETSQDDLIKLLKTKNQVHEVTKILSTPCKLIYH